MSELRKNRIWGCITTSEAIERLSSYEYFFANANHCLVISDEQPKGTVLMTEEFIERFKTDDWMWIDSIIDSIRREQLEKYPELAEEKNKSDEEFLKRFRQGLLEWREANGGTTEKQ
jgi:hypothetical protein